MKKLLLALISERFYVYVGGEVERTCDFMGLMKLLADWSSFFSLNTPEKVSDLAKLVRGEPLYIDANITVKMIASKKKAILDYQWFEVRMGSMSKSFTSVEEAKKEIARMKAGCPDNKNMSDENRAYWIKASEQFKIYRVIQNSVEVK